MLSDWASTLYIKKKQKLLANLFKYILKLQHCRNVALTEVE